MSVTLNGSSARARDQRRLGREKRREMTAGSRERSAEPSPSGDSRGEGSAAASVRKRLTQTPPGAAALVGAAVGVLTAVLLQKMRNDGNEISGDVAVHLLDRIELLTIKLQVRQARRGGPVEIDVHRVQGDTSSRP
jgi:hypothetical protein